MRLAIVPAGRSSASPMQAIALVAGEEAVEDLAAVARKRRERLVDVEGFVERRDRVVDARRLGDLARLLACAGADRVQAQPSRQLGQPGPDRRVVPKLRQVLVRAGEDLLEDVLRVGLGEAKRLDGDRVHVAGEAIDELAPRVVVSRAAAGDELGVGFDDGHVPRMKAQPSAVRARFEPRGGTNSRARPRAPVASSRSTCSARAITIASSSS